MKLTKEQQHQVVHYLANVFLLIEAVDIGVKKIFMTRQDHAVIAKSVPEKRLTRLWGATLVIRAGADRMTAYGTDKHNVVDFPCVSKLIKKG